MGAPSIRGSPRDLFVAQCSNSFIFLYENNKNTYGSLSPSFNVGQISFCRKKNLDNRNWIITRDIVVQIIWAVQNAKCQVATWILTEDLVFSREWKLKHVGVNCDWAARQLPRIPNFGIVLKWTSLCCWCNFFVFGNSSYALLFAIRTA